MTSYEYDFRDDANPYREAESHRSGDPSPECNSATQRASFEEVPGWSPEFDDGPSSARGLGVGFIIAIASLLALGGLVLFLMS